jgi:effector-binding domain-containing protein
MDDLVPIGRFSRMTRLSIKALRLYDEQGLLAPARVDPTTGYRYYSRSQVNRAEAIRILRMVDMPLDEIRDLLAEHDPDFTSKRLAMHRERLAQRLADQERMLRFLERLIDREGGIMPYDVLIKQVPAQPVASLTVHTSLGNVGNDIPSGFATVIGAMTAAGVPPIGAPFLIYHDVIDEQTDGDIEICIPVPPAERAARDDIEWKEISGGTMAATTHRGPYDEVTPAYHAVTGWIHDHGHQITAPPREIYLNDPRTVAPDDLLTEIQFPIDEA